MAEYVFKVVNQEESHVFTMETRTVAPDTLSEVGRHAADVANGFRIGLPVIVEGGVQAGMFRVINGGVIRNGVKYTWSGGAGPTPPKWPAHHTSALAERLAEIKGAHSRMTPADVQTNVRWSANAEVQSMRAYMSGTEMDGFWPKVGHYQIVVAWEREAFLAQVKDALESPNFSHTRAGNPSFLDLIGIYHRGPTGVAEVACYAEDDIEACELVQRLRPPETP